MCKELHITIDKELKEVRRTMYEQMENADRDKEEPNGNTGTRKDNS